MARSTCAYTLPKSRTVRNRRRVLFKKKIGGKNIYFDELTHNSFSRCGTMSVRRVAAELGRALRETGAALDATGLRLLEKPIFKESFARHRPVSAIGGLSPTVPNDAFVAPSATVIGDVSMGPRSAVMYGAVVRGDLAPVSLGAGAVVGARAVLHAAKAVEGHVAPAVRVGAGAIVGPGAVLHACTVEAGASVGAGAHVGEGALVEVRLSVARARPSH